MKDYVFNPLLPFFGVSKFIFAISMDVLKKGQKCRKVEENLNTIESYFIYVLKIEYGWNQVAKSSPYFWLYVL